MKKELDELKSLEDQLKQTYESIKLKKKEICDKYCPVEMGSDVVCNGWSHEGKTMVAENVSLEQKSDGYSFKITGTVKKKNGKLGFYEGKRTIEITEEMIKSES